MIPIFISPRAHLESEHPLPSMSLTLVKGSAFMVKIISLGILDYYLFYQHNVLLGVSNISGEGWSLKYINMISYEITYTLLRALILTFHDSAGVFTPIPY